MNLLAQIKARITKKIQRHLRKLILDDYGLTTALMLRIQRDLKVYNDGERQASLDISGIEKSHLSRYRFAHSLLQTYLDANAMVLDGACGCGYGSYMLSESFTVAGIDVDPEAVSYAKSFYSNPRIEYTVDKLQDATYPGIQAIVSFETLEHIEEPSKLVEHFYNELPPGGHLIISTPNEAVRPFSKSETPFHVRHYTSAQLTDLLESAGFHIVQHYSQKGEAIEALTDDGGAVLIFHASRLQKA